MRLVTLKILQTSISGRHFNAIELQIYKSYCCFLLKLNAVYSLGKLFMYAYLSEKKEYLFLVLLELFWDFCDKVLLIIIIKRRKNLLEIMSISVNRFFKTVSFGLNNKELMKKGCSFLSHFCHCYFNTCKCNVHSLFKNYVKFYFLVTFEMNLYYIWVWRR